MPHKTFTWIGILITYCTLPFTGMLFRYFFGEEMDDGPFILKELINLAMVGLLLWIVLRKEQLPLATIGISRRPWKETALWTALIFVATLAAILLTLALVHALGLSFGESKAFDKLSAFSITLVCLRAGIAEEVFMRGFQLERWNTLLNNKWLATALSLLPFALLHYTQGLAGILISFAAGAVLSAMYWWKRNLPANMIAHFLIDFMANIGR